MSLIDNLNPITAAANGIGSAVEKVAGVFTSNAENDAKRSADEQTALLRAYQEEFANRENRNWVDSIADGFNRLVRPFIVSIVVFIFIIAYINPEHFIRISQALSYIPNGYWALLSVIIGFYFGGRMQLKSQDFELRQSQVDAVKSLIETRQGFRQLEMDGDEPDKVVGDSVAKTDAVKQDRVGRSNRVVDTYLKTAEPERSEQLKNVVQQISDPSSDPVGRVLGGD